MAKNQAGIVIVGAGHAAGQAAASIRQQGHDGEMLIIGDEPHPPYQRPPLSKQYLSGEQTIERVYLRAKKFYADKNIAFDLLNARYINPDAITIISTELTIDRILSWDEAIGSRINQRAKDYMLNIGKKQNWRLQ